jgi:hypothetical protein
MPAYDLAMCAGGVLCRFFAAEMPNFCSGNGEFFTQKASLKQSFVLLPPKHYCLIFRVLAINKR